MTVLAWVVVGLIAGFLGSRIVNRRGQGILLDLSLGIGGALLGGYLFTLSGAPVNGWNTYSVLAATTGAALVLFINHGIRRAFADRLT